MTATIVPTSDCEWPRVAVHSSHMGTRGQRIKRERIRRRMSQFDLANATGVSMRTIGRIEKGEAENSPSAEVLEYHLGIGESIPPADPEETGSPPRAIEQFTLMELLAEAVRRVAQIEARTGERMNGDQHLRIKWPTSAAPSERRKHENGGEEGTARGAR